MAIASWYENFSFYLQQILSLLIIVFFSCLFENTNNKYQKGKYFQVLMRVYYA